MTLVVSEDHPSTACILSYLRLIFAQCLQEAFATVLSLQIMENSFQLSLSIRPCGAAILGKMVEL